MAPSKRCSRVLVIGSPGSGKSTYARKLSAGTGLPLYSLDHLYWGAGWTRPDPSEFDASWKQIAAGERWIIEGNHFSSMIARMGFADMVVFLDIPPWRCLLAVAIRGLRRLTGDRSTLPVRVAADPGYRAVLSVDPGFVSLVRGFRKNIRPRIRTLLEERKDVLTHLVYRSRSEAYRDLPTVARRLSDENKGTLHESSMRDTPVRPELPERGTSPAGLSGGGLPSHYQRNR